MPASVTVLRRARGLLGVGRHPGAAIIAAGPGSPPAALPNPRRSTTLDDFRPPEPEPQPKPPGLFAQIRSTRGSAVRLATAHIDLAKAEASAIKGEIARVAAFVGIAVAVALLAIILLFVGSSLFLAEWLLGSMGWGVLHGVLLLTAIAVACGLAAVGMSSARIGRAFLVGVVAAVGVGVLLTLALPNRLYTSIGDATLVGIEPGVRPLVVGAAIWAVIGLVGGLVGALRTSGAGARFAALLGGIVLGALIGAVTAVNTGPQVAVGIGITVGYITWIGLMALDISRTGVDMDDLKARFLPTQTIETTKETLAWLQSKMPPGTES